jgi:tRNA modification GTPase
MPPCQTAAPSTDQTEDTIVARSTPSGSSLQAVVRLSGPRTNELIKQVTDLPEDWIEEHPFDATQTTVHTDQPRAMSCPGTLFLMQKPRSYTGEHTAELHVPGSMPLVELIIEQLDLLGARLAEPGEFTERAFLNGQLDLAQAEAVLSLIEARSEEERQMALGQLEGKLSEKIDHLRERLTHLCAYVESALDFADQDIDVIDRDGIRSYLEPILSRLREIIDTGRDRNPVREDRIGAFYGRPNVGKSSLFNTLIEEDRSIVTEIAGTTRDVIEGTIVLNGQSVRLLDTAGVEDVEEETDNASLQKKMTERAEQAVSQAELVLHLEEARTVLSQEGFPDVPLDQEINQRVRVVSKLDVLSSEEQTELRKRFNDDTDVPAVVLTSADEDTGIERLKTVIQEQIDRSGGGGAFRLNIRHLERLREAEEHLSRARDAVDRGRPYELIAVDLRDGLDALGEIVGEVGIEDILGVIFSEFCIGK